MGRTNPTPDTVWALAGVILIPISLIFICFLSLFCFFDPSPLAKARWQPECLRGHGAFEERKENKQTRTCVQGLFSTLSKKLDIKRHCFRSCANTLLRARKFWLHETLQRAFKSACQIATEGGDNSKQYYSFFNTNLSTSFSEESKVRKLSVGVYSHEFGN